MDDPQIVELLKTIQTALMKKSLWYEAEPLRL